MNNKNHLISTRFKKCLSFFLCSFLIVQIISLGVITGNAEETINIETTSYETSDFQSITYSTYGYSNSNSGISNQVYYYFGTKKDYGENDYVRVFGDYFPIKKNYTRSFTVTDSGTYYFGIKVPYSYYVSYGIGGQWYSGALVRNADPVTFYKTTLNANGGKCEKDRIIVKAGQKCIFPEAEREGYIFKGWSEASWDTSGVASYTPDGDSTFYACWEKEQSTEPAHTHVPITLPAVPATCTETGLTKGSYCATCGEILEAQTETPKLGHYYELYKVVAPTCQKQGYTIYQCLRCLDFKKYDYTDTVPHKYENGVCIYCNAKDPDSKGILGDVDLNGETDTVDATYIQRYATRVKVPFTDDQMLIGDVDSDGDITVADATFIQRYTTRVKTPYKIGEPV